MLKAAPERSWQSLVQRNQVARWEPKATSVAMQSVGVSVAAGWGVRGSVQAKDVCCCSDMRQRAIY